MVDLATWANVAEIVGGATVVGGVLLAVFQIHRFRASRRRQEMLTLVQAYQTFEFSKAMRVVAELPDGMGLEGLQARSIEDQDAAWFVMSTWEAMGVLVHRREVTLDLVEAFYAGAILVSWRKLGRVVEEGREAVGRETYFEWFQWLVERIQERESQEPPEPAHVAHADWTA